uniref:Thioredoxin domain-containing protein 17 n=1 Tax=Corethrella appendiculata TaxID=1370023 RepID=U5EXP8_9DIPT
MVNEHKVAGYENFKSFMKDFKSNGAAINILFTGEKDKNGVSWCPDCVSAEPHIKNALEKFADKNSHFICVDVGDRATWKDMNNPFRKDKDTHLMVIPTLIRYKHPQRLEGEQLEKEDLLEMFFNDDD